MIEINIIIFLGVWIFIIGIIMWPLFFSSMAKSTKELGKLNIIWEDFNKNHNAIKTRKALGEVDWKYHEEKADLLHDVINLNIK